MKRYDPSINGVMQDFSDGGYYSVEDVQALCREIWPHFNSGFDHAQNCIPISSGMPCSCGADDLRDKLKAIIEAKP